MKHPFGFADRTQAEGILRMGIYLERGELSVSGTFDELRIILNEMTEQLEEAHQWDNGTHPGLKRIR